MNILSQELKMITWCSWVYDLLVEDQDKADHAMKDTSDMVEKLHNRELCPVFEK